MKLLRAIFIILGIGLIITACVVFSSRPTVEIPFEKQGEADGWSFWKIQIPQSFDDINVEEVRIEVPVTGVRYISQYTGNLVLQTSIDLPILVEQEISFVLKGGGGDLYLITDSPEPPNAKLVLARQ